MKRALWLGLSVVVLSGCPSTGIVCRAGTERCGNGCSDFTSDSRNCGGCGQACLGSQVCTAGECKCRAGTTLCDGQCVVLENDPKNCGMCGQACDGGQVCFDTTCGDHCPAGAVRCGGACALLDSDALNCGACGRACPDSQSCRGGSCTWDLVAACLSTGQLAGLQSGSDRRGPLVPMGSGPVSLAQVGDVLLVLDTIDNRVLQAKLPSLEQLPPVVATGASPNHLLAAPPYVYSVNSISHTVQVLRVSDAGCPAGSDAGCAETGDGGIGLMTVGAVDTGANTFPQAAAKVGSALFVPLWGDIGANAAAGQKVMKIDVSNPASPTITNTIDLKYGAPGVDLFPFDAGEPPTSRPYAVVELDGGVWVALNNTTDGTPLTPRGPGVLALINPTDATVVKTVSMGAGCQNAVSVTTSGGKLFVSCGGAAVYDMSFRLIDTPASGVVRYDPASGSLSTWSPRCPPNDPSCLVVLPSRLVVRDGRVYLGDQNGGRIFVADLAADGTMTERRGYAGSAGGPIQACGVDLTVGFSNVSDIISLP
ncbi:MAG: hypothetical protein JNK82_38290 [Myxococcaceae bacterium]|nr:hypothetical protein [Myxococcaceae bacterium]